MISARPGRTRGIRLLRISAVTGDGLPALLDEVARVLDEAGPPRSLADEEAEEGLDAAVTTPRHRRRTDDVDELDDVEDLGDDVAESQ